MAEKEPISVLAITDGICVTSRPAGAWTTHKAVIEPFMMRSAMSRRASFTDRKPAEAAVEHAPEWGVHLHFASELLIRFVSMLPEVGTVHSLQIQNPDSGFVAIEEDTVVIRGDLAMNLALHLLGNNVDSGSLLVNDEVALDFSCDCRGRVDVTFDLPDYQAWLPEELLQRTVQEIAREHDGEARVSHAA